MKAVILAAGMSSRIRSITNGLPKCLLQFAGRSILDFQIQSLFAAGIESIAILVGHGKEHIVEHVMARHPEKCDSIQFIVNPRFATTNNIYSLWLARNWIGSSDFLCLNADVLFEPRILLPAVTTRAEISVILDDEFREETMKVIRRQERILAMRKGIPRQDSGGTYIGITTFSHAIKQRFFEAVAALIDAGRVNEFFNVAVERLIAAGVPVSFTRTGGLPWAEIDDAEDLRFARTHVHPVLAAQAGPRAEETADADQAPGLPAAQGRSAGLVEPAWALADVAHSL